MKIGLADNFHVNQRNFLTLFEFMKKKSIEPQILIDKESAEGSLINAAGDYSENILIQEKVTDLRLLSEKELLDYSLYGVNIFDCAMGEALSRVLATEEWQTYSIQNDRSAILSRFFELNVDVIIECMAAAIYWINYWHSKRTEIYSLDAVVIFSGSMIYCRTLMELLRFGKTKSIVIESLFTGNEYYIEERYSPIPNSSVIKLPNVRKSYRTAAEAMGTHRWEREKIKAINRLIGAKNKNVVQPNSHELPIQAKDQKISLILGQVANDYSVIDGAGTFVNTIPVYKDLIKKILSTTRDFVIFKAHPWEHKKVNIKRAFTYEVLQDFIENLPKSYRNRVLLVDDFNISTLFHVSRSVWTICSQSAMEAAFQGFKPFVLGRAFYGSAGFTNDFDSVDEAVQRYATDKATATLSLEEFSLFGDFITMLLQQHAATVLPSGVSRVEKAFEKYAGIAHQKVDMQELTLRKTWGEIGDLSIAEAVQQKATIHSRWLLANRDDLVDQIKINPSVNAFAAQPESSFEIQVEIINSCDYALGSITQDRKALNLSYHLYNERGERVVFNGERTLISGEVAERGKQTMRISTPPAKGNYHLVLALVCEGVAWIETGPTIAVFVDDKSIQFGNLEVAQ